jgi:hypothetical protein
MGILSLVWDAFDKYERVKDKAKLVIEFYNKLHPTFTEEFFRGLRFSAVE